jgi:hypothetical protein
MIMISTEWQMPSTVPVHVLREHLFPFLQLPEFAALQETSSELYSEVPHFLLCNSVTWKRPKNDSDSDEDSDSSEEDEHKDIVQTTHIFRALCLVKQHGVDKAMLLSIEFVEPELLPLFLNFGVDPHRCVEDISSNTTVPNCCEYNENVFFLLTRAERPQLLDRFLYWLEKVEKEDAIDVNTRAEEARREPANFTHVVLNECSNTLVEEMEVFREFGIPLDEMFASIVVGELVDPDARGWKLLELVQRYIPLGRRPGQPALNECLARLYREGGDEDLEQKLINLGANEYDAKYNAAKELLLSGTFARDLIVQLLPKEVTKLATVVIRDAETIAEKRCSIHDTVQQKSYELFKVFWDRFCEPVRERQGFRVAQLVEESAEQGNERILDFLLLQATGDVPYRRMLKIANKGCVDIILSRVPQHKLGLESLMDDLHFLGDVERLQYFCSLFPWLATVRNSIGLRLCCRTCGIGVYFQDHIVRMKSILTLLNAGADPAANNQEALREACRRGFVATTRILLNAGADLSVGNHKPLRLAARNGRLEVVKLLLENGADVHAKGDAVLRSAAKGQHRQVFDLLRAYGASVQNFPEERKREEGLQ